MVSVHAGGLTTLMTRKSSPPFSHTNDLKADDISIVAISAQVFDNWPTWNGLNPNENPICGQHLEITCAYPHSHCPGPRLMYCAGGGKSLVVKVADRCPGCDIRSLDMSAGAFEHFATLDVGLLGMDSYTGNITWSWVEGSGA
jgi:hypothetical protein